jgi:hypothetical protein
VATKQLIEKLASLLEARLADFQSGLLSGYKNARVTGYVVSSDFTPLDFSDRQALLERLLREMLDQGQLADDELAQIGPIIAMTPAEADLGDVGSAKAAPKPKKRAG